MWTHWGLIRLFHSKPKSFQLVWISSNKIHSKINVFHTLALTIVKLNSILLNLTHRGLSKNTKNALKFQYSFQWQFDLVFIEKKSWIINSFHTIAPNKSQIKSMHPYTHASRAFQKYQEPDIKSHCLRDLSMTNKTKQTTLLHR